MLDADDEAPDLLDWLIIDALIEEKERKRREAWDVELERIFGPGWLDDVRKTIEDMDERDRRAAVDRIN